MEGKEKGGWVTQLAGCCSVQQRLVGLIPDPRSGHISRLQVPSPVGVPTGGDPLISGSHQ